MSRIRPKPLTPPAAPSPPRAEVKMIRGKRRVACPACVTVYVVPANVVRIRCQHCGCAFEVIQEPTVIGEHEANQ